MKSAGFEIEITKQGWIDPERDDDPADLCSHGDIRLEIGGQVIVSGEAEPGEVADWWTISTSALALLRTLESDHSPDRRVADRLILHCGMVAMQTCPMGVDWSVTHLGGRVRLHDVVRFDSIAQAVRFPELEVELAEDEYRRAVVAIAEKASNHSWAVRRPPGRTTSSSCTRSSGESTTEDSAAPCLPSPSSFRVPPTSSGDIPEHWRRGGFRACCRVGFTGLDKVVSEC